jgi:hypothetical protein
MSRIAWRNSCRLGRLPMLRSGATSKRSALAASAITFGREQAERESACSPAATPASRSRPLAVELAEKIRDTFGPGLLTRLRSTGRIYVFSRTCRDISLWGSERSERTWSEWVTRLRRVCLRRQKRARRTSGSGFSSSQWPTAKASTGGADPLESEGHQGGVNLKTVAQFWQTPAVPNGGRMGARTEEGREGQERHIEHQAAMWSTPRVVTGTYTRDQGEKGAERLTLEGESKLWPTPVAQPANGTPEDFIRRKEESVARGNAMGICLSDLQMVAMQWPTPRASMTENGSDSGSARRQETGPNPGLKDAAAMWGAPTARDHKDGDCSQANVEVNGLLSRQVLQTQTPGDTSSTDGPTSPPQPKRRLNPLFVEWMMGWPGHWSIASTVCGPAEMELYLSRQRLLLSNYLQRL